MKTTLLFALLAAFLLLPSLLQAQTRTEYQYDYDATGNRIKFRVVNIPKGPMMAPPADTIEDGIAEMYDKSISGGDDTGIPKTPQVYEEKSGNLKVKVYPNPTQGKFRVVVECNEAIKRSQLKLASLNGKTLYNLSDLTPETDIDITGQPAGVYLMQIQVNDTASNWKIVKQ